jgi:lipopolysaccharide heptosyltransferase II
VPDLPGEPVCRPAGIYGPYRREAAGPTDLDFDPSAAGRLVVICERPLHHALEFAALYRRLCELRSGVQGMEIDLRLCSALPDDEVFAALPADRIGRLSAGPFEERATYIYKVGEDAAFAACPPGDAACTQAVERFHAALAAASPRWLLSPGAGPPLEPRRLLVHQSRFRVGDTLWLTPLLRAIRRRFPGAEVTVVAVPLAVPVLERSSHVSNLMVWDPAGGEAERRRVLERLGDGRFDAALFALARRDKSRWLAEAAAAWGIPCRVNLEYFDAAEDGREPSGPFTHEAWFFWGTLASPELLLHALDPWGKETADRRVELPVSAAERREADRILEDNGFGDQAFTVLAPAGHSSDRWPPERFAELGVKLAEEWGHGLLIEGAPADEPVLRRVGEEIGRRSSVAWQVRTDPLGVLAALLERASLLVSNDSAPIHVAEAAGAPVLYFAQHEKLVHSHPAGEASWALYDEERNRLADITVEQALGAVSEMARRGLLSRLRRCVRVP